MQTPQQDLKQYLDDNYGECRRASGCCCREPGAYWLGQHCPFWLPLNATDWKELKTLGKRLHEDTNYRRP